MKVKDYITKGKEYYYKHYDWDKALACFNSALVLDPNNAVAYMNQANVLRVMGFKDEALKAVNKAFSLNSKLMDSFFIKSRILADCNDFKEALKFYEMGQKIGQGKSDESYYCQAKAAEQLGYKDETLKLLDKAAKNDMTFYVAVKTKIMIYASEKQHKKVIETCEYGLKYSSGRTEWWCAKAEAYAKLGMNIKALECYDKAIETNPGATRPSYEKGMFLMSLYQLEDALHCFNDVLFKIPDSEQAIEQKELILKLLVDDQPQNHIFYQNQAEFYLSYHKEVRAIKVYLKALDAFINTDVVKAQEFGKKILNLQYEYNEKNAKEIDLDIKTLFQFAEGMKKIGEHYQCGKYFNKILTIDNTYTDAHIGMINALIGQNKYAEATKYIRANKYILGELHDELSYALTEKITQDIIFPYLDVDNIEQLLAPQLIGQGIHPLELIEN